MQEHALRAFARACGMCGLRSCAAVTQNLDPVRVRVCLHACPTARPSFCVLRPQSQWSQQTQALRHAHSTSLRPHCARIPPAVRATQWPLSHANWTHARKRAFRVRVFRISTIYAAAEAFRVCCSRVDRVFFFAFYMWKWGVRMGEGGEKCVEARLDFYHE